MRVEGNRGRAVGAVVDDHADVPLGDERGEFGLEVGALLRRGAAGARFRDGTGCAGVGGRGDDAGPVRRLGGGDHLPVRPGFGDQKRDDRTEKQAGQKERVRPAHAPTSPIA
ncbi:hypothetical protein GCM10009565_91120 [Amycolatopsis albidoflavus]